jgi:hypothetical protein
MSAWGNFGACWHADSCTLDPGCELFGECELRQAAEDELAGRGDDGQES